MKNKLSTTLENYLEAIFEAQINGLNARSKDIATRLGVCPATVTSALRSLSDQGFITYEPYGRIYLTEDGQLYASRVARRHRILQLFFSTILDVDAQTADAAACKAEHVLDDEVLDKLSILTEQLSSCPKVCSQNDTQKICCCQFGKEANHYK